MWISGQIADNTKKRSEISRGYAIKCHAGRVTVKSGDEYKDIPVISPSGISYLPREGEEVAIFPSEGGAVCSTILSENTEIEPGELMIKSPSGGYIRFKNDGQVVVNGQAFAKEEA